MSKKMVFFFAVLLMLSIRASAAFAAVETADFEGLGYGDITQIAETVAIDGLRFSTSTGMGVNYRGQYGQDNSACVTPNYTGPVIGWVEFQTSDSSDFALTSLFYNNNTEFYQNCASTYRIEGYDNGSVVKTMTDIDVVSEASRSGTITFIGWDKVDTVRITALSGTNLDVAAYFDNIVYETITISPVPYMVVNQSVTAVEGGTVSISNSHLQAADNDSDDSALQYTMTSGPTHGHVETSSASGSAITTFTQGDIDSGRIRYVHDHSDTTSDSFVFKVSDGVNELTNQTFNITVTPVYDDPIPSGASVATFDDIAGTFVSGASIPYSTAIDGFLFRSSADLGMIYYDHFGQDNTPSLMTNAPGNTKITGLTIKKEDGASFKLFSIHLYDSTTTGSSEYTFEGYLGADKIYTKSNVNVKSPVIVTFNWENINEIRVTAVTGTEPDIAAYFDNIVYRNENSAPTNITLLGTAIAENAASDATIGSLSTTDINTGDTFTYSLMVGTGDTDNSSFVIDGETLKLNSVLLDYETKNSYSIRLKTTDNGGLSFEKVFVITVTDVDESTVIPSASVTGISAPAAGAAPAAYISPVPGDASYTVTNLAWENEDGSAATLVNDKFKADSIYKAVIELTAAAGYKFPAVGLTPSVNTGTSNFVSVSGGDVSGNKLTFTVTFGATASLSVTGIAVTSQPVLSYIEGQTLDLTSLKVTLTYNDSSTEQNISPAQFSAKGITVNPAHGTTLTVAAHNTKPVQLLCNGQTAQTSALTVTTATYTITATESLTFGSVIEGYSSAPTAQTVTINNTGNSSVTINPVPTATNYTITGTFPMTIAAGGSNTFTVQPKTSLAAGTYHETLTVTTDHSTSDTVDVSFAVQAATYTITATESLTFDSVIEGYSSAPTAQTVTINNTGSSSVTITSAPTATNYTITGTFPMTIAAGGSNNFTVQPKIGLGVGTHSETITVSTDHSTSVNVGVSFTVQSASYAISVAPLLKTFLSTPEGMAPSAGETFTVTNDGNMPVTLTQPTATNYIIGTLSAFSIDPTETATFTVAPKSGLTEGSYTETITISGSNGASAQAEVRFTVTEALTYAIAAAPASMTFDSLAQGYLLPDTKTVTVTNTGNQSISLYQPTASRYTIGTLSATSLAPAGTATFTVVPKDGLAAGTWNETIHICGSNGVSAQVDSAFTCTEPLDYYITSGNGSTYQQDDPDSPDITVTANGDVDKFTGLTLNGELVDESNYDVTEGSTIVTLHQDFLDTLIPGTYTLMFHYTDGQAEADFVVHERMPVTGDNDALLLFGSLIVLSLAALILIRKKQALR